MGVDIRGVSVLLSLSVVGLILAGAAAACAWLVYRDRIATAAWPTTTGVVLSSEMRHTSAETLDHRRQLAWTPVVKYQYSVGGKTFVTERISGEDYRGFTSRSETPPPQRLRALVDRYPAGATITVHYNPGDPSWAALEVDHPAVTVFASVAAGLMLLSLGCLGAAIAAHRKLKNKQHTPLWK